MKYQINGETVTAEEMAARTAERVRLHGGISQICEDGQAPGGHACYWGTGHVSLASGVPAHQASELQDWVNQEGLAGVEVQPDGSVKTNSPGNRKAFLDARGLVERTPYGTNGKKSSELPESAPEKPKFDEAKSRQRAKKLMASEKIRSIVNR